MRLSVTFPPVPVFVALPPVPESVALPPVPVSVAQYGYFDYDATQCGYKEEMTLRYNETLIHCGSKNELTCSEYKKELSQYQQCLLYIIKLKDSLLGKKPKSSFEKKMKPVTINRKFNYFIFLSDNMSLYFIDDDFVKKILHIAFFLQIGFYYHHDFVALLNKLHKRLKIFNFAIILILCLHLYTNFFSKYYAHQLFLICQYLIFKNINQYYKSKTENYSKSVIGGGAHDSNFISSELFPYNDALSNMIGIFKFHIYVADSMKLAILKNNSNLYECNIPLNLLIWRLKLSELKLIASAHQIKHGSKVKINELQDLIIGHKCQSCVFYTSIFEFKNQIQNKKIVISKQAKNIKVNMLKNINLVI